MLIYITGTNLPWHTLCVNDFKKDKYDNFVKLGKMKFDLSTEQICRGDSSWLGPFFSQVNNLKYEDEPNYGHLRHLLITPILNTEEIPDMKFDWTPPA